MKTSLKFRQSIYGNGKTIILLYFLLSNLSCYSVIDVSLKTSDPRFSKVDSELQLVEMVNGDSVYVGISSKFYTTKEEAARAGHKLGIEIDIFSERDLRFFASGAFLIDKNSKKFMPHSHSIFREDNYYGKERTHQVGIIFQSRADQLEFIHLPGAVYLPPLIFTDESDTLKFSKFTIQ